MNKTTCFRLGFAACSALAAILQCLAVLLSFEDGTNYFENGALLPILATVFAILGGILGTLSAFTADPTALSKTPFSKSVSFSPLTVGFAAAAILLLLQGSEPFPFITAVLLLLATLYAILVEFPKLRETVLPTLVGMVAVLALIAVNAYYYFDMTVEMNAPIKVTTQLGLLCTMLALTGELRYLLGKPMPRLFVALSAWVVSIGALSALSVPLAYLVGKIDRIDYATGGLLVLCAVLTALLRLKALLCTTASDDPSASPITDETTDESNRKDPT